MPNDVYAALYDLVDSSFAFHSAFTFQTLTYGFSALELEIYGFRYNAAFQI